MSRIFCGRGAACQESCTPTAAWDLLTSEGASLRLCWQLAEDACAGATLNLLWDGLCCLVALLLHVLDRCQGLACEGVLRGLAWGAGVSLVVIILQGEDRARGVERLVVS